MCRRPHGGEGVALPQELLLHEQLLLACHPLHSSFGLRAAELCLIQPLTAQLHSLFEAAFQHTHPHDELCVAGPAFLPSRPAVHPRTTASQPGVPQSVQFLGRVLFGVQLIHDIREQMQAGHIFRCHAAQIIVKVQVGIACRGVVQQFCTRQQLLAARCLLFALAEVGGCQRMVQHQLAVGAGGAPLFLFFGQGRHLDDLHRRRREQLPQQLIEPALFQLLPQGSEQSVRVEQQGRVAGVEPSGRCIDGVQHAVRDAARPLKGSELGGVEACHQQLLGDALLEDSVHGFAHCSGKLARRLFRRAP